MEKLKEAPLEKSSSIYNLIIPQEVERKIRYFCNKISQVEWSGILFYTYSGTYEEDSLEVKCVDILLMNIGCTTYTEFEMSPDVIRYMTDHPELLNCEIGLIHSHNMMSAFFSGTDLATLQKEGNCRNHFVSLIVNNAGTYTAAITRKLHIVKTVESTITYKTFNNLENTGATTTMKEEEEFVSYNIMTVIKEGEPNDFFQEIDDRIEEIKKGKESKDVRQKAPIIYLGTTNYQKSLFDGVEPIESEPPVFYKDNGYSYTGKTDIYINPATVKSLTLQLITGSIAIPDTSKIDPVRWSNQMVRLFDKRFNEDLKLYSLWAEAFIGFIVENFIPKEYSGYEEEYTSELCKAILKNLDTLPNNKYITILQDTLTLWMK